VTRHIKVGGRLSGTLLAIALVLARRGVCADAPKSVPGNTSSWLVRVQPSRVVNGSPIVFQVSPPIKLESLSGTWLGRDVFFTFDPQTRSWFGIAGASLETRPGRYALELHGVVPHEEVASFQYKLVVGKAKYHSIAVSVPKQYTQPSAEQLQKIAADKKLKEEIFGRTNAAREWNGNFVPPVKAEVSDVFGTTRVFNGHVQSVHQGLDYAVREGTVVAALNSGDILLAAPLFFEGNCVVIDHGQGLLSIYMHLSKIEVKQGDHVARGQELALSGGTGRATGPHLHVAVRWQGIYLDPIVLLTLRMP
jgi:murein DD-endopeptidase MepM/ murein hydrolase activator NlpD